MNRGVLTFWDDLRGFGFLRPYRGHAGDFVHAQQMRLSGIEPAVGRWYSYRLGERRDGRPQAIGIAELVRAEPVTVGGDTVTGGGQPVTVEQAEARRVIC